MDFISAKYLVVISHYSCTRCYHWGKLGESVEKLHLEIAGKELNWVSCTHYGLLCNYLKEQIRAYHLLVRIFIKLVEWEKSVSKMCNMILILGNDAPKYPHQFSSVAQSWPTLCDPTNHSTPGLLVHHQLPEFTQTHVHRVGDAIQPSHPLWSPFPPAPNPSQHQSLFQWVNSSHDMAKLLEFQL